MTKITDFIPMQKELKQTKADLAAARAEIERLTKERDEARAQVAAAATDMRERAADEACYACGSQDSIRILPIDLDAQSALEARDREKVREGMRRAARRVSTYLREANLPLRDRSPGAQLGIADAILAAMEKEAGE